MNLGLGLIAADEYFREGDRRKVRDYEQAKRDAELSTLADKTDAERSGYRLRAGQNQQGLELMPGDTANKRTQQQITQGELGGTLQRQPTVQATQNIQANMGLSNAQNAQTNLPKTQAVQNNALQSQLLQSNADLTMLPEKIRQAAVSGQLSGEGQRDVVLGTLGQIIARQDKSGAIDFANRIAQISDIMPNTNGKKFTDIAPVRGGPDGDGYNFTTSDGMTRFVPVQAIQAAMGKMKSGEYQFIHDAHGNVFAGNKATGAVTQTHQGDPKLYGKQHTPAEIQTMNYLIDNKVARDHAQAWEMVRSAREKTRNSFIMDFVGKNALPGQDSAALEKQASDLYDRLRPSNSAAPGTLGSGTYDPRIQSLIGVPSQ